MGKAGIYKELLLKAEGLLSAEPDLIAGLANMSALIQETFHHHWTGFYLVKNNMLVLGPFQGPVACTRIAYNKGVCGRAWAEKQSQVVEDVHRFEGHIACSPYSNSEIVVPVIKGDSVVAVLDIDSTAFSAFDEVDKIHLEQLCNRMSYLF